MELNEIKITKSDERGIIYNCGKSSFISKKRGQLVLIINMRIQKLFIWLRARQN